MVVLPELVIVADPACTCPPVGSPCAMPAQSIVPAATVMPIVADKAVLEVRICAKDDAFVAACVMVSGVRGDCFIQTLYNTNG